VPVGPWRCLPMITSALPCAASMSVCHLMCSSVPGPWLLIGQVVFLAEHEQRPRRHPCSIEPDSRRSESCGRLSSRFSTWRESCESAISGPELFGQRLEVGVISVISCTRFSEDRLVLPCRSWDVVDHDQVEDRAGA